MLLMHLRGCDDRTMTQIGGMATALQSGLSRATNTIPWLGPRLALRLHRSGLGATHHTWCELAELIEGNRPQVLSVDVFDTCVVRDLLGDRPIEVAISSQLERTAGSDLDRRRIAADTESLICKPVPGVVEALRRIRATGVEIVFLSDTDRSSESLIAMLEQLSIFEPGDELIASCEAGATKSDGDLFGATWTQAELSSESIWHVGNNLWSDITMAEQAGLKAIPIVDGEPTRYESAMAVRPDSIGPAVASAARMARLTIEAEAEKPSSTETRLEVLGAQVAGQPFAAFLLWAADRARVNGLDHLTFLSRDGELPLQMAKVMPVDHWDGITFSYLHCSRWSWMLAGAATHGIDTWMAAGTSDDKAFIHSNRDRAPFESILGRIGLGLDDLENHHALSSLDPSRPLPADLVGDWETMLDDDAIRALILERATDRRDLIAGYLADLGLPRGRIGLVDVGWRGRLAWAMSPLVAEVTGHDPLHLHFGGNKILPDVEATTAIERFAFGGQATTARIDNPVSCVETLTASGRARVVGYERDSADSVAPVFEREVPAVRNADRRLLWNGAIRAASCLPSRSVLDQLGCSNAVLADEAVEVLALWWTEPERYEAEAMRGLSFEADDDGHSIRPVLAPYSPREISSEVTQPRQWQQGSVAVSPRPFGAALGLYRSLRQRIKRLR